ncbi:helicase-exonuclease AddAB subunit AddA [Oceanobacillus sp. J11TS1]|uniref:helicase-exonuclease AddAB subunit AddA n=1 Tax=Oceanobacillus sp. J11TS1 TaxID=2807191 RepID=UPI001AFE32A4|nr:helicase-exonuclease AddAB subunit AddA [Oceanobacillus sp. J11TS1]GIO21654.1 ATP-dependent helicase/nuclease subunit A [Oceanobacillus sp. J11TS1]
MVKWTKEQEQAIYQSGTDILVAAAAGSGKTAVLVERIIQKLLKEEDAINIDELLVVTFTNAAAQEMRARVGAALEKALAEKPGSLHLKKQLSLLQRASISTLHSFCLDIVRKNAYMIDLDPSFRIADEVEMDMIKREVLDELLEGWYDDSNEEQEQFFEVVNRFSNDRSDRDVEELILKVANFAVQHPMPHEWLHQLITNYEIEEDWKEETIPWLTEVKEEITNQLEAMKQDNALAIALAREPDGPYHYLDALQKDTEILETAVDKIKHWDELQQFVHDSKFAALSRKKVEDNPEKREQVKAFRKKVKDRWDKMKEKWFVRSLAAHIQDMQQMAPVLKQLVSMVEDYMNKFQNRKKEQAIVDFNDLEHYCLQILSETNQEEDTVQASSIALQLQKQFKEVLVDEYQDTNLVQESILQFVRNSENNGNMFMVGDVKQSIYGFRHAEPSLFIQKYKQFAAIDYPAERIDLNRNFRSRKEVLIGANYLFRQLFDEKVGDIEYDQDAELIYGNRMYDDFPLESNPELLLIDLPQQQKSEDAEETEEDLEKAQIEARAYAKKIQQWIGGAGKEKPMQVVDKGTGQERNLMYRDIVILMRSMTWAPAIMDELKKQGIPVYAELTSGYFEAIEIRIMISLLKVIDNPRQDIPLAAVLRSPIVGLKENDLATIRLANRHGNFYDALVAYMQKEKNQVTEHLKEFKTLLDKLRVSAQQGALSELIWQIYRETGYYDFVGGIPGGKQRQANLRALYDRARSYEETSFRGLYRFLRFIERMEEEQKDLGAARALSEQEDVVRIMTIHKSKGLEFPVVILGGIDKEFNLRSLNEKYLLHKDLGFASKFIDPEKRIQYSTLFYNAMRERIRREQLSEEIRLLYVALTRAEEKLLMVGTVNSMDKRKAAWSWLSNHADWVLPGYFRIGAKNYLDWIGPALLRHHQVEVLREEELGSMVSPEIRKDPSSWDVQIHLAHDIAMQENARQLKQDTLNEQIRNWEQVEQTDKDLDTWVEKRFSYQYPFKQAVQSRAKQSVTELKRQQEQKDAYSDEMMIPKSATRPIATRPRFMQVEKKLTPAEKGTALHTVMQHLPLKKSLSKEEVEEFIEKLVQEEKITAPEAESVSVSAIVAFLESSIAQLIFKEKKVFKEVPFSLMLPAEKVYANWQDPAKEKVLIQGVIDCIIPSQEGWIILDYKTDRITEEITDKLEEKLKKRYKTQLDLYRYAIEEIWKQPVTETYLYFFSKRLLIKGE